MEDILHERIEGYLKGTLDTAQLAKFEQDLGSDSTLQKEVDRHRRAALAINYALSQSLKSRLRTIDKEIAQPTTSVVRRIPLFRRIAVAASILVLIGAGIHFYAYSTYSTSAVTNNFFAPSQGENFRGQGDYVISLGEKFEEAERLFQEGNYEEARQRYLEIIKEDSLLKGQAEWNLTLCYYAMDPDSAEFKILFERILADTHHDYHSQAVKLQQTMHTVLYKLVNH